MARLAIAWRHPPGAPSAESRAGATDLVMAVRRARSIVLRSDLVVAPTIGPEESSADDSEGPGRISGHNDGHAHGSGV